MFVERWRYRRKNRIKGRRANDGRKGVYIEKMTRGCEEKEKVWKKETVEFSPSSPTLRGPRLFFLDVQPYAFTLCASSYVRESLRGCRKETGQRRKGGEAEEVEAESYLVKNRLRAAHLVPFARTTSGLMHSARWKRASVCLRRLGRRRLGRRRRRRRAAAAAAIDLSNVVAGSVFVVDSHSSARFLSAGVATRKRDQESSGTGVVVKSVKSP